MANRNVQRAARAIQAECGAKYTTAYNWVAKNTAAIVDMIVVDDKVNWKEYSSAACGLWRREHARD